MNIKDALSILGLQATANTSEIKTAYKKSCSKFHPDRNPAGLEMMKAVNLAYQFLIKIEYNGAEHPINDEVNIDFSDELYEAISAVINLKGLIIEVCGSWIWLSGETKEHKATIKNAGYWWAKKKCSWYFRPADYKSKKKSDSWDLEKIRSKYGSVSVSTKANHEALR